MNTVVLTLELEKGADVGLIEKMIKNMKGVLEARLSRNSSYHNGMDAAKWYEGVEAKLTDADLKSIQRGLEDVKQDRTHTLGADESLDSLLERL